MKNSKIELDELNNLMNSIEQQRDAMSLIADNFIDSNSNSVEVSIGYALRLVNLLCDYFYENDEDLYDDLDSCGDKIKKLYNELNY